MKTPTNIGGNNLITFFQNNTEFKKAELYTITLKNGTVLRYTDWQTALTVLGVTFNAGPPNIKRGTIEETVGFAIATLDLTISAKPTDLVNGIPLLQYIAMGFFDGAALLLERLIMDMNGQQIGKWIRFGGEFGQVDEVSRGMAKVTVSSNVRKLQQKLPRTKMQAPCANTLFDSKCTLNPAGFTHATTVNAGSTANKLVTGLVEADGYYDLGRVIFTSGANIGVTKSVRKYVGGLIYFNSPLPFAPSNGDTLNAIAGCDKLQATCSSSKFNNLVNFAGFPFVPKPETAY